MELPVGPGRRGEGDPLDAGDLGRDRAHQHARGIGGAAAGRVDAGGADRHFAHGHRLPLGKLDRRCASARAAPRRRRGRCRGDVERLAQRRVERGQRRAPATPGRPAALAALLGRVEARGQLQHRLVAAARRTSRSIGTTSTARRASATQARIAARGLARAPQSKRRRLIAPLASRSFAVSPSTSRRAACGRRGWRRSGRCTRGSPRAPRGRSLPGCAGGDEVDDAVAEADQRRQLDRALDLDHLDLAAGLLEVALGDARVLGRDPHHPQPPLRLAEALVAAAPGEHHPAAAEAEVEQLVDGPVGLLEQHVLAGDADVGGAGLDVGGNVGGTHRHQGDARRSRRSASASRRAARAVSMPAASSTSSVSPKQRAARHRQLQRPVGLGAAHAGDLGAHDAPLPRLLLHLGDVDALQVEGEACRRQVDAEALSRPS